MFHNLVFVSIKKTYPMQAYKIMHGFWGMGQMMLNFVIGARRSRRFTVVSPGASAQFKTALSANTEAA